MLTESLPISIFVKTRFHDPQISKIIEDWPVESSRIENIAIATLEEMGIFAVQPHLEREMTNYLIHIITQSPEIRGILSKAIADEKKRRRSRYSEK